MINENRERRYRASAARFRTCNPQIISEYSNNPPKRLPKRLEARAKLAEATAEKALAKIRAAKNSGRPMNKLLLMSLIPQVY